jgi:hypothetical protein
MSVEHGQSYHYTHYLRPVAESYPFPSSEESLRRDQDRSSLGSGVNTTIYGIEKGVHTLLRHRRLEGAASGLVFHGVQVWFKMGEEGEIVDQIIGSLYMAMTRV